MCNCLGRCKTKKKSHKKDKELLKSKKVTFSTPTTAGNATVSPQEAQKIHNPKSTFSNLVRFRSSPSAIKTTELTEVLKISKQQTPHEVASTFGFELGSELGKGSFATVFSAKRLRDGLTMACKVMRANNANRNQSAKNELFVMEKIKHPHIIKLYGHFIVEMNDARYVFILMALATGGSLSVLMRSSKVRENPLGEATCKRVAAQIISALSHMHSKGVAHCDIKMGNVLLDQQPNDQFNCLLADFGLSRIAYRPSKGGTQFTSKFCGTRSYMAPEILLTKEYSSVKYDPLVADVWALGVLLWCVFNQKYPFDVEAPNILQQQLTHKIKFSKRLPWTPDSSLKDMFFRLLEPNVDERIKMPDLSRHPWVASEVILVETKITKSPVLVLEGSSSGSTSSKNPETPTQKMTERNTPTSNLETSCSKKSTIGQMTETGKGTPGNEPTVLKTATAATSPGMPADIFGKVGVTTTEASKQSNATGTDLAASMPDFSSTVSKHEPQSEK